MSNKNPDKLSKLKVFWEKYEKRVVLALGILLIATVSFEIGILQGHKLEQQSLVIEKAPEFEFSGAKSAGGNVLGAESAKAEKGEEVNDSDNKECPFVGSKNSDKYHKPDCQWAKRIKPENLVCFKSAEVAEAKGYKADKCIK